MANQIHKNTGLGYAILHFYLYSSLHIALCAIAITYYSYLAVPKQWPDIQYVLFVGSATLLLYSLHRIIGITKSKSYADQGRFAIIIKYKSHLIIYSCLSALYCLYAYYTFDWSRRILLIIPAIISLSYSLPIFFGGKRLRDFHWIKIFIIALCWSVITFTIPVYELATYSNTTIALLTIERCLFIFAITIPFDIRDRKIDKINGVRTLATQYNDSTLKVISWASLCLAFAITLIWEFNMFKIPSLVTYIITAFLISETNENQSDYFFTGKMDGTMMLPLLFCIGILFLAMLLGYGMNW